MVRNADEQLPCKPDSLQRPSADLPVPPRVRGDAEGAASEDDGHPTAAGPGWLGPGTGFQGSLPLCLPPHPRQTPALPPPVGPLEPQPRQLRGRPRRGLQARAVWSWGARPPPPGPAPRSPALRAWSRRCGARAARRQPRRAVRRRETRKLFIERYKSVTAEMYSNKLGVAGRVRRFAPRGHDIGSLLNNLYHDKSSTKINIEMKLLSGRRCGRRVWS